MAWNSVDISHQDLYDFVRQSCLTIQKSAIIKTQLFQFIKLRVEYDAESLTNEMEFDVWTKIRLFVDQLIPVGPPVVTMSQSSKRDMVLG